jgi:hypothetical protein
MDVVCQNKVLCLLCVSKIGLVELARVYHVSHFRQGIMEVVSNALCTIMFYFIVDLCEDIV